MTRTRLPRLAGGAALLAIVGSAPAQADELADFFQSRQITLVVSWGPGGSYSLYAQLVANHISQYLPGKPKLVMQYMPGAGGVKATNYLYNAAPKDGSTIGTVFKDLTLEQALRPKDAKYDARKFGWIGRMNEFNSVITVWHEAGVKTFEDARKKDVVLASSGRGHQGSQLALLLNEYTGSKFKLITGYAGGADMNLAMERGEAHARINSSLGLRTQQADWIRDGKVISIAQGGQKRRADMPNVPLFKELITDPVGRQILAIVESGTDIGWALLAPPSLPADRLAAWRTAFDRTMQDKGFIAAIEKARLELSPMTGQDMVTMVERILAADPTVVAKVRKIADVKD